jgi:hypothetical protein
MYEFEGHIIIEVSTTVLFPTRVIQRHPETCKLRSPTGIHNVRVRKTLSYVEVARC